MRGKPEERQAERGEGKEKERKRERKELISSLQGKNLDGENSVIESNGVTEARSALVRRKVSVGC